ncbi:8408_t:CDS:2, partial [Cetraspora pellucida]
ADTILKYASQNDPTPPKIIGLFAFDTPYYGVHERVFSKAALERVAGAALVGGAVYSQKDNVSKSVEWLGSHLEYVGVLWKKDELKQRVENLVKVPDITFHCFYTQIPPNGPLSSPRTFIFLPPPEMLSYFSSAICDSKDEIDAHIYMFDPEYNKYYYDLGHVSARRIIDMVDKWEEQYK